MTLRVTIADDGGCILEASDFIATARRLADTSRPGRPRETDLRRAISTAYYALFHCLAACCADTLVGGPGSNRSMQAWNRMYRSLEHGTIRKRCQHRDIANFPPAIRFFVNTFVSMQNSRHDADYAPDAEFRKEDVIKDIDRAENAIRAFAGADIADRKAFAVHVLFDHNR